MRLLLALLVTIPVTTMGAYPLRIISPSETTSTEDMRLLFPPRIPAPTAVRTPEPLRAPFPDAMTPDALILLPRLTRLLEAEIEDTAERTTTP